MALCATLSRCTARDLVDGGDLAALDVVHHVLEADALVGDLQHARAHLHHVAGEQLLPVGDVLLHAGHAEAVAAQIGGRQPQRAEQAPARLVELGDVGRDVHVPHVIAMGGVDGAPIGQQARRPRSPCRILPNRSAGVPNCAPRARRGTMHAIALPLDADANTRIGGRSDPSGDRLMIRSRSTLPACHARRCRRAHRSRAFRQRGPGAVRVDAHRRRRRRPLGRSAASGRAARRAASPIATPWWSSSPPDRSQPP